MTASGKAGTDELWRRLARVDERGMPFEPRMVDGMPDAARRWLLHAIAPGTVLAQVVELRMHGTLRLKRGAKPLPMRAEQVLAPPEGFVWRACVGRGLMQIRGYDRYDGAGEMRWWLLGIVPVVSQASEDVTRSAAGRLGGEAVLIPAALLPQRGAQWEGIDERMARVRVDIGGEVVVSTVRVSAAGALERGVIGRWNGDPANGAVGYLPFVVDFAAERTFAGYTIPTELSAGWSVDGETADPFFRATIDDATFR